MYRHGARAGLLAALVGCGDAPVDDCVAGRDGVTSAGRVPAAAEPVTFSELWRVGGLAENQHFAVPLPLALSAAGRSAIADFQLGEASVVEADGTWRGRIARRGMGPGELSSPVAVVWDDDGTLHVFDIVKNAIVRFDAGLQYIEELRVHPEIGGPIVRAGSLEWGGVQPSGHILLRPGLEARGGEPEGRETLVRMHATTAAIDTLASLTTPVLTVQSVETIRAPGYPRLTSAVGAGGRLAVAGVVAEYEVFVYGADGAPQLHFCAAVPAQPLTDTEQGRSLASDQLEIARAFAGAPRPPAPAAVGRVIVGADGTIWVQRQRADPVPSMSSFFGRPGGTFDVFSPEGRHLRTLDLPAAARLQGALGDTIWVLETGELDDISLVTYRIES